MRIRAFCIPGLLLALLLLAVPSPGTVLQAQELEWAKSAGGALEGNDIAADPQGNSYVTGSFNGTAAFGAGEDNETVLTAAGDDDIFVAKYAPDGTLLWATSAGGTTGGFSGDYGRGIATDLLGNSYVTGSFSGTATFGAGEDNETVLTTAGFQDIFIAKYAPDGTLLWATSAGGISSDHGHGIAADPLGNAYVTGFFFSDATFGAGEDNETVLINRGFELDTFVAKYAPDGTLLWATSAGDFAGSVVGHGIATDPFGNNYVTGSFSGTATFGAGETNETVLREGGTFVAKYAPDGTLLWATRAGASAGLSIAADPLRNAYVTGFFFSDATFGAGEDNETVLTTAGLQDIFIAKYAPDGTLLWATSAGGISSDHGHGIAADPLGNAYVTGYFQLDATFGAGEDNETVLTAAHVFTAKYGAGTGDDSDGDGVADAADFCPGTILPETVPTSGRLLPKRFAITDQGPAFSTGKLLPWQEIFPPPLHDRIFAKRPSFTTSDTHGCSCEQIIDYLGLGEGHRKHGCSIGVMRKFIKQLPE